MNKTRLKKIIKNFEAVIAHFKFIESNNFNDSYFINETSFKNLFTTSVSDTFVTLTLKNHTNTNSTLFIFDITKNIFRDDMALKFSNFDFNNVQRCELADIIVNSIVIFVVNVLTNCFFGDGDNGFDSNSQLKFVVNNRNANVE